MELLNQFINLLFPKTCCACNETLLVSENIICTSCMVELPKTDIGFSNSLSVLDRFMGKTEITAAYSFLKYTKGGKAQNLLHHLKYKNRQDIGIFMGQLFGKKLLELKGFEKPDILVAVPLHKRKKIVRGFNQSDLIAEGLANVLDVPHETEIIFRSKATESQTKKSRIERFDNVDEVFEIRDNSNIVGKKLGLVDDVLTTGATMDVCATALINAGAKEVHIFSLAAAI